MKRWIGLGILASMMVVGGRAAPYINWHGVVPPIDAYPLVIRHDAKGDGRFDAPRSGHRHHRGIDFTAILKSPVHAIRSGTVIRVAMHRGLGEYVEIEHDTHLRSLYAHLDTVAVSEGARVSQGEVIGTVGKTGNARHPWITPHLHLEVLRDGTPIDPETLGFHAVQLVQNAPEPASGHALAHAGGSEVTESEDASGGE